MPIDLYNFCIPIQGKTRMASQTKFCLSLNGGAVLLMQYTKEGGFFMT